MTKGSNPWQRFFQYGSAHMHEEVNDDRLDRAVRIASGDLIPNPPFVKATFELEGKETTLIANTISKEGMAVWLFADFKEGLSITPLRLVTWHRDVKKTFLLRADTENVRHMSMIDLQVLDGSLVIVMILNHREVHCTDGQEIFSHTFDHPADQIIPYLENGLHFKLVWRMGGEVFSMYPMSTRQTDKLMGLCTWIGLVDGVLTTITLESSPGGTIETLRWRDIHFQMPHPKERIIPETISVSEGGIQLVARRKVPTVYWTDGTFTERVDIEGYRPLLFDRGEIWSVIDVPNGRKQLVRLTRGLFTRMSPTVEEDFFPQPADQTRILNCGVGQVIYGKPKPGEINKILWVTPLQCTEVLSTLKTTAIGLFHNRLVTEMEDGTFHVGVALTHDREDPHLIDVSYPLYGRPFDRLTQVKDGQGKAIMSCAYTNNTIHILRYPIPDR